MQKEKQNNLDVIFYETFKEEEIVLKKYLPSNISAAFTRKTIQEYGAKKPPSNLISIRTQSKIPIKWANTLAGILTRSQGYDHIIDYFDKIDNKISAGYIKEYCSRAVAGHSIFSMFFLLRKMKQQIKSFNTFVRDDMTGIECKHKNVLILGMGNIGCQIADMTKGLKMRVKGVDIKPIKKNIERINLTKGLLWADVIFCALPLTEKTRGLLNYKLLRKITRKPILINISRGEITPIIDMQRLLDEEIIAGLAVDVYENENQLANLLRNKKKKQPKTIKNILALGKRNNVLFTPHNAFNTQESLENKAALSIESIKRFLSSGTFPVTIIYHKKKRHHYA